MKIDRSKEHEELMVKLKAYLTENGYYIEENEEFIKYVPPNKPEIEKKTDELFKKELTGIRLEDKFPDHLINWFEFSFSKKYNNVIIHQVSKGWTDTLKGARFYTMYKKLGTIQNSYTKIKYGKVIRYLSARNLYQLKQLPLCRLGKLPLLGEVLLSSIGPVTRDIVEYDFGDASRYFKLLTNREARKAKNVREMIENILNVKISSKFFHTIMESGKNSQTLDLIFDIYNKIPHNELSKFQQFVYKTKYRFRTLALYMQVYYKEEKSLTSYEIFDYIDMIAMEENMKYNLNIGEKRMQQLHDDWVYELNRRKITALPELKTHERFIGLEDTDEYTIELINTTERLAEEGHSQDHCVLSYHSVINSGDCAIYSVIYKGERYTLEVEDIDLLRGLQIAQLRGRFNSSPPAALLNLLSIQLDILQKAKHRKRALNASALG